MSAVEYQQDNQMIREGPGKQAQQRLRNREALWGYLFISPWIVGFLIFAAFPIVATFALSFTDFPVNRPQDMTFIGSQNYALILQDSDILNSIWVTIRYAVIAIPIGLSVAMLMATLVNSEHLLGKNIFRTLFYMPQQIPVIVGVLVWTGVMNSQTGWINTALELIGINGPDWMQDVTWIYPALTLIGLWGLGSTMLIYLAAMQGIPSELYDAAKVDGAGPLTTFFRITIPLMTPVIFYTLTLAMIGAFQYFDVPYILSNGTGRPGNATMFYTMLIFKNAFTYFRMGYSAAMAWILFLIVLVLTIVLFSTARRWVHYSGGGENE
jgi:multiple sugar transport system permease protein